MSTGKEQAPELTDEYGKGAGPLKRMIIEVKGIGPLTVEYRYRGGPLNRRKNTGKERGP